MLINIPLQFSIAEDIPFEDNALHFEFYNEKNGLPFKPITVMYQDKNGYIWLGSEWGLCRYNGYKFDVYSQKKITSIIEDDQNNLWVSTSEGLLQYDPTRQAMPPHTYGAGEPNYQQINNIYSFVTDKNGIFWLGTQAGLVRYDRQQKTYQLYSYKPVFPEDIPYLLTNHVHQVTQDQSGLLWLGMYSGLVGFDPSTETFEYYPYQIVQYKGNKGYLSNVNEIICASNNKLWLHGSLTGLVLFDPVTKLFKSYKTKKPDPESEYNQPNVTALLEDENGIIWAGGNPDLYRFDPRLEQFVIDRPQPERNGSLNDDLVYALLQEHSGAVWVSTENGLNRYDPYLHQFRTLLHNPTDENSLTTNQVYSICEGVDGSIWIGTLDGLNRYDPQTKTFTHYRHEPNNPNTIPENTITALEADSHGNIWIGTWHHGLCVLDPNTDMVKRYPFTHRDDLSPSTTNIESVTTSGFIIRAIYATEQDGVWIGLEGGGVNVLQKETDTFIYHRSLSGSNGIPLPDTLTLDAIRSIHQTDDHDIWMGTGGYLFEGRGLNRYTPSTKTIQHYLNFPPLQISSHYLWINGIDEDQNSRLWLATNYGLFQMIDRSDDYNWYTPQHGFVDREIRSVLCTDDGYIWCSTANSGLSRFHPDSETVINFDERSGIQNLSFWHDVGLVSQDGTIYFGGEGGVTYLPQGKLKFNPAMQNLRFETIQFDSQTYSIHQLDTDSFISLDYWQNSLSVTFSLLHYTQPTKTKYQYRVLGISDQWTETDRNVQIAHLLPGEYQFEVKAENYFGNVSDVSSFRFKIHPPFWQTIWFQIGMTLLLIFCIYSGVRWRISSIQSINKNLETQVQSRTSELRIERDHIKDIILSSPVLIIETSVNGVLNLLNPVAESLFGVTSKDVLGEKWWKLASNSHDREKLQSLHYQLQNENSFTTELPITFRTGKTRNIVWNCINHYNEDGQLTNSVIFGNDITEHFEKEILETSNREQQNIGREIHDSICQSLAGVGFMCESLTHRHEHMTKQDAEVIRKMRDNILKVTDQSRRIARGLYLQELEHGLEPAIQELSTSVQNLYSIPCHYTHSGTVPIHDFERATHLYRIVQEALSNAGKYSQATSIAITSSIHNGLLTISVEDNGIGFQSQEQEKRGMGLEIMRFRSRMIDAKLEIISKPNVGTTVTCTSVV